MITNTNNGKRYYGNYRGQVKAWGEHGKCKIFVPTVFSETFDIADLPYAEPTVEIYGGNTDGDGVFSYPAINTMVWVFFEAGDQNRPIYYAATPGGAEAKTQYARVSNPSGPHKHLIKIGAVDIMVSDNGIVDIVVSESATVNVSTQTINISANVNILGNVMVTGLVTASSNIASLGGTITAPGDITSTGANVIATTGDVVAGTITLKTHMHSIPGSPPVI